MDDFAPMPARRGRAAAENPPNRFERLHVTLDPAELDEDDLRQVPTEFLVDTARSALARNDSPDVPFTYSVNPYRGCEHGCVYCYARPSHEYLGFSAGLDFETRILVKHDMPQLLAAAFDKPSWRPQSVALSGNTDCYQPVERKLQLTRRCLEVFLKYRNPVTIVTKNQLVVRDADLLAEMAAMNLVMVTVSLTTLRPDLVAVMEPRTARPEARLKVMETLAARGVPIGVNVAPIIPGLTDDEMPAILKAAAEHGATFAHYQVVRLPGPVRDLFLDWLERHFPDRVQKVTHRLESLFGPNLTRAEFGKRMQGEGPWADLIQKLFVSTCRREGIGLERKPLYTHHFRRPTTGQIELF